MFKKQNLTGQITACFTLMVQVGNTKSWIPFRSNKMKVIAGQSGYSGYIKFDSNFPQRALRKYGRALKGNFKINVILRRAKKR